MPANTNHPCFKQPRDENILLWRYMDFTKFVALISSKTLFFSRADLFDDTFEGSYPLANLKIRPYIYQKNMTSEQFNSMTNQMANIAKCAREWTYINCWHANKYESAAMWNLYAKTNEAVAIVTDYKKLKNNLPNNVYLGVVNYIDYEKEWIPEGNIFSPFLHKRKSFEHEKEVRAIIQKLPNNKNQGIVLGKKNSISGISVNIDIDSLIKTIYVSPTAPQWIFDLTKEVLQTYKIKIEVIKSNLYSSPVF